MLLRAARLPLSGDYAYEPKWDGFRCLASQNGSFRAVSRRGWDMTSLLPELAALPDGVAVDGELVAFGSDGLPKVVELSLEGVVAKKRSGHYLPGRRDWIKVKNRAYWRYPLEAEAARRAPSGG